MATPNIVPRADQEGGLGTAAKSWGNIFINQAASKSTAAVSIENSTVDQNSLAITSGTTTQNGVSIAASNTTGNIMAIASSTLTTGSVLNSLVTVTPADGATNAGVINLDIDFDSTGSSTAKGVKIDIDKDGITASGKTAFTYGLHVDLDDTVNNVGTTHQFGVLVNNTYSNAGDGTTNAYGVFTSVAGADNNYDIYMENAVDNTEYAYMRVGTGGQLSIVTESDDTTGHMTLQADGYMHLNALNGNIVAKKGSDSVFLLDTTNRIFQIYDSAQPLNTFFRITETTNGATTIATIDGGGTNGHMTLDVDGDLELNADGGNITFKDGSADLAELTAGSLAFGNGQATTIAVDASGSGTVGRDLTIEAGSTPAASANTDGGDLIFKTGLADGTGSSIMTFATATSVSDATVTEKMRIHTDGNIGIGNAAPGSTLEVSSTAASSDATRPTIEISSFSDANDLFTSAPVLKMHKSANDTINTYGAGSHTAAGEVIGRIEAWGVSNDGDGSSDVAVKSAYIEFAGDSVAREGSAPGKIVFATTSDDDDQIPSVALTISDTQKATFSSTVQIGADADGTDRMLLFGHSTLKSSIGIDDDQDVFAINTDATFEATNDLEIDASGNVTIGNGAISATAAAVTGLNYRTIWVDAGSMIPAETNGAQALTEEMHATNFTTMDYMAFDKDTEEFADFKIVMPEQYDNGTVKVKFYWKPADAESGVSVVWGVKAYAATDSDALTGASGVWGTEVTIEDASLNTNDDLHISSATAAVTIAGTPAEGKLVFFRVARKVADGNDDYADDAHLLGINVQYRESATASAAW